MLSDKEMSDVHKHVTSTEFNKDAPHSRSLTTNVDAVQKRMKDIEKELNTRKDSIDCVFLSHMIKFTVKSSGKSSPPTACA